MCAKAVVNRGQNSVLAPLSKGMKDRLVGRKRFWEQVPRATGLYEVEDGVDHQSPWRRRPAGGGGFGQHRGENLPLGIGDIGVEIGVLHRLDSRCRGNLAASWEVVSQVKICGFAGFF